MAVEGPVLTTREAARYCGLGVNGFRAAVARGEVAHVLIGARPRFLRADLDAFLARQRVPAAWERALDSATRPSLLLALPGGLNPLDGRPYGATANTPASPAGRRGGTAKKKAALAAN